MALPLASFESNMLPFPLSDDVRLTVRDDGRLPYLQERIDSSWTDAITGGTWRTLDVPVTSGPAGTLAIDGEQLRDAVGQQRFNALGTLDGRGISLTMQPAPIAPRDVPSDSIFAGDRPVGTLHSPQGTVVDWTAHYAQTAPGQTSVLELRGPEGLTWTNTSARPIVGALDIAKVDPACPRYSDVNQVAVEADVRVRAAFPGLSARDLGTLIHQEVAKDIRPWPEIGVGMWSEEGFLMGVRQTAAVLPIGASRIDVLEDAGKSTVCIYDIKTGDSPMRPEQMLRYWQEAIAFRPGTTRVFVIPLYTKR